MKKLFTLILTLSIGISFAQNKRTAEKYFNNYDYLRSAELYEKMYEKGDSTFLVLSRIADSYYLNAMTDKSEFWYRQLFEKVSEEEIPTDYYFKYAQSLKSNKKYQESDKWLLKFRSISADDSRGKEIESDKDYLATYTKKRKKIIELKNLSVNTSYSDFGAHMSGDSLVFSSTRPDTLQKENKIYKWNNQPFLNVYSGAQIKIQGEKPNKVSYDVAEAKKLISINTKYHEASVVVTKDGNTKYFTRNNYLKKLRADKKRTVHLKLYKAEKVDGVWGNITELPFNSDNYSTGHPTLSPDEKTLYFVSDMPGSIGQTDIYKVGILSDETYGEPENLGPVINTEGKEMFPFISSDNMLYFSSDGHLGLGFLDVFSSKPQGDKYTSIDNLGSPFNSSKDDFAFTISASEDYGYLSSNRDGGKGDDDIYSFTIREPEIPCTQKIAGIVVDKNTGALMPNTLVTLFDASGNELGNLTVGSDATYEFAVACNANYRIVGTKRYFVSDEESLSTANKTGTTNSKLALSLSDEFVMLNGNLYIKIDPIYFDLDKSNIRPDAAIELDKVVAVMKKYPEIIVESGSHTDSRGTDLYNEKLSDRRTKSSVRYIISKGISQDRISGKGYGENKPVNKCVNGVWCNEAQHQLNRRTEFVIVMIPSS